MVLSMFLAALVLILSTASLFFYLQATCQKLLAQRFDPEIFLPVVNANRLEFLSIYQGLEVSDAPVEFTRLRVMLKCDFLALTYLLKNAANLNQRYSREERLLIVYFRLVFLSWVVRHALRLKEKAAILKLTSILCYFASVVGQRVSAVRFGSLATPDFLLNL